MIFQRGGVWQADGRSNSPNVGRHSLGTRVEKDAVELLKILDLRTAVRHGVANESLLNTTSADEIELEQGKEVYLDHARRPGVRYGARPKSIARYRAVLDKAILNFKKQGLRSWNQIKAFHLDKYALWLAEEEYLPRTTYLELTTVKQVLKYLISEKLIPSECAFNFKLRKPTGTDTHCWRWEHVQAMIEHCEKHADLLWIKHVIIGLARTGMRISELSGLRWGDIDLSRHSISLKDESGGKHHASADLRTTKNKQSRSFPIHPDLQSTLATLRGNHGTNERVFTGPAGGRLKPDTVRVALVNQVLRPLQARFPSEDGETGFKDGRLHSFRHFFCSECCNDGVPQQTVMLWLGHQSSAMVRHYFHLHDREAQLQMKKVRSIFETRHDGVPETNPEARGSDSGETI